ncbi:hypothetical protein A9X05_09210 [Mycobacterium sp. E3298]|nr:hypothetical protein [Mycobacterium sp. E3298]OBG93888.1 hypothetical protein A9X05_09210 [Mycobacterium sp. E3298]
MTPSGLKFSEFIRINKPEYIYLKLKPNNSIRNNSSHKLARTITTMYKNIAQCIKQEEQKLVKVLGKDFLFPSKISIQTNSKVTFFIYIEKKKVEFYFIIPKHYLMLLKEKMSDIWSNVTVIEIDEKEIPKFNNDSTKYQLTFKKEDGLSLAVDRRNNDLLNSNLNIVEVLEDGDRVGLLYNFLPSSQRSWKYEHKHTLDKIKTHKPVERNKLGIWYVVKYMLSVIDGIVNNLTESVAGKKAAAIHEENTLYSLLERLNGSVKRSSDATIKKGVSPIIPAQIVVVSESENKIRERNVAISMAQSFDCLREDNELIYKPLKSNFKLIDYSFGSAERNKFSDEEAQNFLSIAGRDLLEKYNFIDKVETHETEIPDDLCSGIMCIGTNRFRGIDTKAYLSNDENYRNLLTLLIGPTRAGKSNLLGHLCIDAIEDGGECVIVFDYIENCELSESIASLFPPNKVMRIKCDDFSTMQGLGYNEVGFSEDVFTQYDNAKRQTTNMIALVNSINADDSRLSPKMDRYLESASLVVFISGGSIRDVFGVLQNHNTRRNFLKKVPSKQYENLSEYMDSLRELDECDKSGTEVVGTKSSLIVGIIDRLNILKRNTYMELMLKKDSNNNIDLSKEMQKNQLITIQMPQSLFTTDNERDICTTYWITKLWLAAQVRADRIRDKSKRTKVNLIIDELYQIPNTEKFLTSKLSQMAKFIVKPIISCHYINQLKYMRDELRSANTSYLLISGSDSKNFTELKQELQPFSEEDLLNLPRYHALCLLRARNHYAKFITKLPGKVEHRTRKELTK